MRSLANPVRDRIVMVGIVMVGPERPAGGSSDFSFPVRNPSSVEGDLSGRLC